MARFQRMLHYGFLSLTSVVATLCLLHLLYYFTRPPRLLPVPDDEETPPPRGFLVDTSACKIPDLDPMDPSIADSVRRKGKITCGLRPPVTYVDGTVLRINRTHIEQMLNGDFSHCRYQAVTREGLHSDFAFAYSELGEEFDTDIEMKDEFIRIYCYSRSGGVISTTFHAFILPKEHVESRCHIKLKNHVKRHRPQEILNVQMVGVDSVSRLNFMRQMPLTRDFLLRELQAVEMLGYNKVADNTFVNIVPMTAGQFVEELPWDETMVNSSFDNFTFIWSNFSKAGYRTLYAEDAPKIAIFVYQKEGFHEAPADYYNRALALAMEKHSSVWNHRHHCVANQLETSMLLNYLTDFSRQFRRKPHFGFTFITRLTHDHTNDAGAADDPHLAFLKTFRAEGHLNNTILIYYSDHGNRFGEMRSTYVGKAEERLPFLFFVFPRWFQSRYPKLYQNLQVNSNRLTTPFDVFETLKDILYFDGRDRPASVTQRGISLFREIPESRSCAHAHILPHWCMCMKRKALPLSSHIVRKTAREIVRKINEFLQHDFDQCARLELKSIHQAEQMAANDDVLRFEESLHDVINRTVRFGDRSESVVIYQLAIETEPGNAVFEGTMKYEEYSESFSLAGDISRINAYGTQSHCINKFKLKKFCFCKSR
ncbi:uncharacterized protein LOC143284270 [Babylonia areolata]|uniref:uncharacterized protein LOC143284270 n=1 Tax=Babylonia areolata TaxID=304850 RepID=UPI003FD61D91